MSDSNIPDNAAYQQANLALSMAFIGALLVVGFILGYQAGLHHLFAVRP